MKHYPLDIFIKDDTYIRQSNTRGDKILSEVSEVDSLRYEFLKFNSSLVQQLLGLAHDFVAINIELKVELPRANRLRHRATLVSN